MNKGISSVKGLIVYSLPNIDIKYALVLITPK
jgi:hypothetical protein